MKAKPLGINKISELNFKFGIYHTSNALINIIDLKGRDCVAHNINEPLLINLYSFWFKKGVSGNMKYGEGYVDFDEGTLFCMSPGQLLFTHNHHHTGGWGLYFHPDLLNGHRLAQKIRSYQFFSYNANQALNVSDDEEKVMQLLIQSIKAEIVSNTDKFSKDVIIAHLDALLVYTDRCFHRQFSLDSRFKNSLLENVEHVLLDYLENENLLESGLPTVKQLAASLKITSDYLNKQLKANTGKSANEYITTHIMEKAKKLVITTTHTASEIAFMLGYRHSQSFSKLFRKKEGCSPLEYRRRFQSYPGYK